jgi:hypothetical protein
MKVTSNILDVCEMTESDFMRLTGKTAFKKADGQADVATDYHGNVVQSECLTFGNDSNGVFSFTAADVAKIGISFDVAQSQYPSEQIRQYLCTYAFMQTKRANKAKLKAKLDGMTDAQKFEYYGFPNERMVSLIDMTFDVIEKRGIQFKQVGEMLWKALDKKMSWNAVGLHAGYES